jgi:hypothetical protein
MKIVINTCFGGFGLSQKAYEKLIEYGIPVRKYVEQKRDPETGLYLKEPLNEGRVIFDRDLEESQDRLNAAMKKLSGRYWDSFIGTETRNDPLLVRVVEELGDDASGKHADLKVVIIPDGVEWTIEEYDGNEHISEKHRTWA